MSNTTKLYTLQEIIHRLERISEDEDYLESDWNPLDSSSEDDILDSEEVPNGQEHQMDVPDVERLGGI